MPYKHLLPQVVAAWTATLSRVCNQANGSIPLLVVANGILFTLPVQPSSYGVALLFQKPKLWVQARYRRQRFCSFPHVESPARLIQELSQAKTTLAELPF